MAADGVPKIPKGFHPSAQRWTTESACRNNLKQLGFGFQLYQDNSHEQFPAPGSKNTYGPQPEDWIWWQQDHDVKQSTIGKYVSGFNPALFSGPADKEALALQGQGPLPDNPYRYSYSLTSYGLEAVEKETGKKKGTQSVPQSRHVHDHHQEPEGASVPGIGHSESEREVDAGGGGPEDVQRSALVAAEEPDCGPARRAGPRGVCRQPCGGRDA